MNITRDSHGQTFGNKFDRELTVGGDGLIHTGVGEARQPHVMTLGSLDFITRVWS